MCKDGKQKRKRSCLWVRYGTEGEIADAVQDALQGSVAVELPGSAATAGEEPVPRRLEECEQGAVLGRGGGW